MKQWAVSYLDKDGVQQRLTMDSLQQPTHEEVARLLRPKLYPLATELDLNDLEGRSVEPTVKTLKDYNSVQIISITEVSG
ncbi:hypothetical protein RRX38_07030 [Pseudomonas sp. DTU_2021_1001937_2_SI_NGA_ILE_001]|uniref:hypothetical protein n=1 Tax=Pseudomonas sp. DTU_2021_1001937_2_SI_NGA_ILE_001 TaxID=3077589 RepID=UPI0025D569B2|nr:hypothetical protein [Pseudomonas sp. DTU_2021_1001937_2_SI_NGA_ILE_001]WNW10917.1 hypothetical protein RRX38_07030 [Pseudomonas sp. DTU_2021_1001937_2_SI_NGA_ILE_001]